MTIYHDNDRLMLTVCESAEKRKVKSMRTTAKYFSNSTIGMVHQTGQELVDRVKGVTVTLSFLDGHKLPHCAEISGGDLYAEIGLEWDGDKLTGYDGVFELPGEIKSMLAELGCTFDEFI